MNKLVNDENLNKLWENMSKKIPINDFVIGGELKDASLEVMTSNNFIGTSGNFDYSGPTTVPGGGSIRMFSVVSASTGESMTYSDTIHKGDIIYIKDPAIGVSTGSGYVTIHITSGYYEFMNETTAGGYMVIGSASLNSVSRGGVSASFTLSSSLLKFISSSIETPSSFNGIANGLTNIYIDNLFNIIKEKLFTSEVELKDAINSNDAGLVAARKFTPVQYSVAIILKDLFTTSNEDEYHGNIKAGDIFYNDTDCIDFCSVGSGYIAVFFYKGYYRFNKASYYSGYADSQGHVMKYSPSLCSNYGISNFSESNDLTYLGESIPYNELTGKMGYPRTITERTQLKDSDSSITGKFMFSNSLGSEFIKDNIITLDENGSIGWNNSTPAAKGNIFYSSNAITIDCPNSKVPSGKILIPEGYYMVNTTSTDLSSTEIFKYNLEDGSISYKSIIYLRKSILV